MDLVWFRVMRRAHNLLLLSVMLLTGFVGTTKNVRNYLWSQLACSDQKQRSSLLDLLQVCVHAWELRLCICHCDVLISLSKLFSKIVVDFSSYCWTWPTGKSCLPMPNDFCLFILLVPWLHTWPQPSPCTHSKSWNYRWRTIKCTNSLKGCPLE